MSASFPHPSTLDFAAYDEIRRDAIDARIIYLADTLQLCVTRTGPPYVIADFMIRDGWPNADLQDEIVAQARKDGWILSYDSGDRNTAPSWVFTPVPVYS